MELSSRVLRFVLYVLLTVTGASCLDLTSADRAVPPPFNRTASGRSGRAAVAGGSWTEPRAGRVRRFLYFPQGSTITVTVDFVLPIGSSGASLTFSPSITFVPTTIARAEYGGHGGHGSHEARSFAADQRTLLDTIGDGFRQVGLDGGACLKRLICEVSGAPRHQDGLLGEVINTVLLNDYVDSAHNEVGTELALFSNSTGTSGDSGQSGTYAAEEIAEARMHGSFHGDCAERYSTCPVSIFNIL